MPVDTMLLYRHAEHLAGGGAVDVLAFGEHLLPPLFPGEPGDDAGFNRRKVGHKENPSRARDKGGADELGEHIRGGVVEQAHRIVIPGAYQRARLFQIRHSVLGQVLQLYVAPGPAACARAVKLEAPAHPPVRADGIFHRLILFHGAFRQLLPQYEHRLERLRRGLEQFGHLFFAQRVRLKAVGSQPVFHLLHGVGVVQHGQFLQPGSQFFP